MPSNSFCSKHRVNSALESLLQNHSYRLAGFLANRLLNICLDRQLVSAVAQRHEGAAKCVPVNFSSNFNQTTRAEKFYRARPDDVGPAALLRTVLQFAGKRYV